MTVYGVKIPPEYQHCKLCIWLYLQSHFKFELKDNMTADAKKQVDWLINKLREVDKEYREQNGYYLGALDQTAVEIITQALTQAEERGKKIILERMDHPDWCPGCPMCDEEEHG